MSVYFAIKGTRLMLQDSAGYDPWTPITPQLSVDTTLPTGWDGTADATPADSAAFQTALDNAVQNGDGVYIIQLTAGATYTGPFKVRAKAGSDWLIIRTSGYASLPATGMRVTGATDMSKLVGPSTSPALWFELGSDHVRLIGIEVATTHATTASTNTSLIYCGYDVDTGFQADELSDIPDHIIFDRCFIHGNSNAAVRKGIQFDATYGAIIDSRITEIHDVGADSQAIWIYQGPGPYKITNNYLEAAGENFMSGGTETYIQPLIPSDITFTRNHCFKPLTWKLDDPSYGGTEWLVKNIFELKCGQRWLVEGNVFENCWVHGQAGYGILLTPRGGALETWVTGEDITFRKNVIKNVGGGIQLRTSELDAPSGHLKRVKIENNVFTCDKTANSPSASNRMIQCASVFSGNPAEYVTISHNTMLNLTLGDVSILIGDAAPFSTTMRINDNIVSHGVYGVFTSSGQGTTGLNAYLTSYTFLNNALIVDGQFVVSYPATTLFPADAAACNFTNYAGGDYSITSGTLNNAGSDGTDIGCDIGALNTAISGVEE